MSETGTVDFKDEEGGTFASVTVGIIQLDATNKLELWPGFYFTLPDPDAKPGTTVQLYGPHETREAALEAAGTLILDLADARAQAVVEGIAA
ncbi:hypothetical protein ABID82_005067 [Methylobacterium sp. PvP062]|uniref:Uncharacterized protein n=1 Tax=Methylobacterium radiotolerans TaxID=31998 RepID=A0ABV2NU31_9HYPH|nr:MULTISPECIES: hypothetical protein [unclassified Methylobacterium]MBP2498381.1 hypothetical protein [Methylobacterium sp. PvP105]MBP2505765.1 hypothetical protein [Methylobacterium sp. PvP109]